MTSPLLAIKGASRSFVSGNRVVRALDRVDLATVRSESLGIVGESGSGKSTLARALVGVERLDAGEVQIDGVSLKSLKRQQLLQARARIQMVFQDPATSLSPRMTIGRILEEPLIVQRRGDRTARRERIDWVMEKVGLHPSMTLRYPSEFSGGQRQRVSIARALMLNPELIICDEAVSALDVSIQAQILNLLMDLREELGITFVFISHDLGVVRHMTDRVAVLYSGRVVEIAHRDSFWSAPQHPYSQTLLAAVPSAQRDTRRLAGRSHISSPKAASVSAAGGCSYRLNCALVQSRCSTEIPELRTVAGGGQIACHSQQQL